MHAGMEVCIRKCFAAAAVFLLPFCLRILSRISVAVLLYCVKFIKNAENIKISYL